MLGCLWVSRLVLVHCLQVSVCGSFGGCVIHGLDLISLRAAVFGVWFVGFGRHICAWASWGVHLRVCGVVWG